MPPMPQLRILPIAMLAVLGSVQAPFTNAQALPEEIQVRDHVNGLRSAALSRPLRATSIVAIDIAAGSFQDSDSTPGLAHLAEHLFLRHTIHGENSVTLRDFLTLHGGRLDAKTSYESTRFYFEINNNALPILLHSLYDFLSSPELSNSTIASEIAAVNDEFSFLKTRISWRLRDALKAATAEAHPFRRFSAGNLQSFSARSLDELNSELAGFFREHYSAAKMSVFLVSPDSSADQQRYLNNSFGKLPSSNVLNSPIPALFNSADLPLELLIRENTGAAQLQLLFPLNGIARDHANNAIDYLKFWSQAEGAGSWRDQLLATQLLTHVDIDAGISTGANASINLSITPTAQGWNQRERLIDTLIQSLHTLITQAQTAPLYDDFLKQRANDFALPPLVDRDFVYRILNRLGEQRTDGGATTEYFVFGEAFRSRIAPDNTLRIQVQDDVSTGQLSSVFSVPFELRKPPTKTQDNDTTQALALDDFTPPVPLGEMTALPTLARHAEAPNLVLQTPSLTTWHSIGPYDNKQLLVRLSLNLPDASLSLGSRTLAELWYEALKRASRNTNANWYQHSHGVGLQLQGDLISLQQQLYDISALLSANMTENEFSAIKADLIQNWQTPPSYRFAFEALVDKLREVVLLSEDGANEKIQALQAQNLDTFDNLRRASLQSLDATLYIYGATREQAEQLSRSFAIQHRVENSTANNAGEIALPDLTADDDNTISLALGSDANALLHYQQTPNALPEDDAKFRLLLPLIKRQYFSSIREHQKLAYGVTVVPVNLDSHRGLALIAQSSTTSPSELQQATRQFLRDFPQWLNTIPESRFEQLKLSLADQLLPKPLQGEALAEHYWSQIADKRSHGDWNIAVQNALREIDREDLSQYFDSVFSSASQRSLILQGWPVQGG